MARCFAKVSEEEIVAINEAAFFYPSDLVNTIQNNYPPQGQWRAVDIYLEASRNYYIFISPFKSHILQVLHNVTHIFLSDWNERILTTLSFVN